MSHMISYHNNCIFQDRTTMEEEKSPEQPEVANEPSVHSEIKEERIAARRKRVQIKIEADRRAAMGEEPQEDEEEVVDPEKERKSFKQREKSNVRLEKLATDGTQLVTNVSVAGDSKEVLRRQEEEEAKKSRYERMEAEITAGQERFGEIMRKWSEGKKKRIPQQLQELLQQQKSSCSALTDEKDKLIGELQQELKSKDDQYVKHLKKQAEDVDLILERMEEQAKTLIKAYREELDQIEGSFATERRELLDSQKLEWEETMGQRKNKERDFLEEREKRIERYEEEIQSLRVRQTEDFNQVKIKLETDIQILQQQIQQMKATFLLNAEKLEYNFQVLKKRDEENTVTMSQQKRRITRLQDTLNNLKGKLAKQEKACQLEMQTLMEGYRKNTEQYRELQKKVKHFQMTDAKRFHDIWMMNEEKVRSLAREVVNADKVIHTHQLGLEWEEPTLVDSPMGHVVTAKLDKEVSRATLYASQILSDAGSERELTVDVHPQTAASTAGSTVTAHFTPTLIKQVLELVCEESEFLIESKLSRLLAPLDKDEQMLMKLDSIFKAVGIESEDDVHELVKYFVVEKTPQSQGEEEGGDDDPSSSSGAPFTLIHPNDVSKALRRYVDHQHQGSGKSSSVNARMIHRGEHEELLDGSFWTQMTQVLPESHERVWTVLLEGLEKYHSTLQSRASLIDETDSLRQQNAELRLLLHQYMHARVNEQLEIPPTLVLPVAVQPATV